MDNNDYTINEKNTLLQLASRSIATGLEAGHSLAIKAKDYGDHLSEVKACFVTLNINRQLRGCIGSLEAHRPLAEDVTYNAHQAAFKDPRFPPLTAMEFKKLEIHISILSIPEPFPVTSELDLLTKIRPSIDGLILQDGHYRGTFLPSVWESLPKPRDFIQHLKQKAGLPPNHWSLTIRFWRYTTLVIDTPVSQ